MLSRVWEETYSFGNYSLNEKKDEQISSQARPGHILWRVNLIIRRHSENVKWITTRLLMEILKEMDTKGNNAVGRAISLLYRIKNSGITQYDALGNI